MLQNYRLVTANDQVIITATIDTSLITSTPFDPMGATSLIYATSPNNVLAYHTTRGAFAVSFSGNAALAAR